MGETKPEWDRIYMLAAAERLEAVAEYGPDEEQNVSDRRIAHRLRIAAARSSAPTPQEGTPHE